MNCLDRSAENANKYSLFRLSQVGTVIAQETAGEAYNLKPAIAPSPLCPIQKRQVESIEKFKMNRRKASPTVTWLTVLSLILTMATSIFVGSSAAKSINNAPSSKRRAQKPSYPQLSRFATNLTNLARSQRLEKTADQNSAAVEQAITILATQKRNPIILEDSALNTRIVAEGIAQRIANNDVPAELRDKELFSLNLDALFYGLETPAEVEARVNSVFAETAAANGAVILFVDQLYQFAGTRALRAVSDKFRDSLDRGDFRIVGATTNEAFEQYIAADASLQRVFKTRARRRHHTSDARYDLRRQYDLHACEMMIEGD